MSQFIANPVNSLKGSVKVPGDKSISHRSIMLGSLSNGVTHVSGFLDGEDALCTLKAFQDMGVKIDRNGTDVTIHGVGLDGLKKPDQPLDLGNSGTSMRLMCGLLSAQSFSCELIGDESLSKRPMGRVINPLNSMGAQIESHDGKPPLKISGGKNLTGISYEMPMASAQVKSSILLAGMYASGRTCVTEPAQTRDHTERMLRGLGADVSSIDNVACISTVKELHATDIVVPSDISSAAFFMVAGCIAKNSDIDIVGVNMNPTRTGVIDILKLMGANLTVSNEREIGGELLADIRVLSSNLKGIHIPEELVPLAIDEFPVIFIAASHAEGKTILSGAEELRVKESDRIQVMADGLESLGIKTKVLKMELRYLVEILQNPQKLLRLIMTTGLLCHLPLHQLDQNTPSQLTGLRRYQHLFLGLLN